ncbi:adenosylcobinamide-GDP ribazoletransferase [Nocardioides sp. Kera G14]|uniref:adenosylcobinamide-GDP ribazoletransferase n=1 Tax=Nocardioides sp. Kera G14 TaxID=2884264 RepID=UPI001D11C208|nr:adenosylcobinamide-GDP ribazoletransferase [Nocardioides sp. Kera G14]UDY25030.1 adenosylcobinamide-GDP ribazoletransferase [Nocardioides sp. Kera G14]
MLVDAWRLALGTLTAVPVKPPAVVDRRRAALAMVIAPLAALPLGIAAGLVVLLGGWWNLPPLVTALLAIGVAVLGNRGFHLDGLSDITDGMSASYDRERSLAVMKTGTSGPAGVVAIVLVLGLQVAALAALVEMSDAGRVAALLVVALCASRLALVACCARGIRPARADGLGKLYTETVPRVVAAVGWIVGAAALAGAAAWVGLDWWRGVVAVALALLVVVIVIARAVRRFGGVTGDVFGAAIELAFATILVTLA